MKRSDITSIISILIIAFSVFYSFYSLVPHKISGKDTPADQFSAARAMEHVKVISKEYHFVGTPYHKEVREYLIKELNKLGLKTEVQSQFSINEKWGGATTNHNILARIEGTGNGKAVMLLSHYDSAPFASKGASDDAIGVASILEGVRAFIAAGTKPVNDIIILFSDGEEIGLNGAKAFVENHPWVKDVGVVINFEARGSGGPSFTLLETNGGNEMMVKAFAQAKSPYPVANSFLYSVYKMLPNDTDLTMFREIADIEGYNFAFIDDFYDYHCSTDNYENIDINTVEHQGSYLMSMLNQFITHDLEKIKSKNDYIYFNFPFIKIIYYPFSMAIPFFIFAFAVFIILLVSGIYLKKISLKKVLWSFLFSIGLIAGAVLFSYLLWKLINLLHPAYSDILHGFPYNGNDYIAAFSFIIAGITLWSVKRLFRNYSTIEFFIPVVFIWLILSGLFTFGLIGASFFIIPVYFMLIVLFIEMFSNFSTGTKAIIYSFLIIPVLLIVTPFIQMFPIGLKLKYIPVSVFLVVLLLLSLLPILKRIGFYTIIYYVLLISGIFFLIRAELNSGFNPDRPKPGSINYVYYADEKKAFWETYNIVPDPWIESIMESNIKSGRYLAQDMTNKFNDQVKYHAPAKTINLNLPVINTLMDTVTGDERIIKFRIEPGRNSCLLELFRTRGMKLNSLEINGFRYREKYLDFTKRNSIISYYITEEGEKPEFRITVDKNVKPEFILYEASYDLFENKELNLNKRPEGYIAMPFVLNDMIITANKVNFD